MSDEYVKNSQGMYINNNVDQFSRYKMAREKAQREKTLASRVTTLEKEVLQLKNIIKDIIGTD